MTPRHDAQPHLQNESERTATMKIDEVGDPAADSAGREMLPGVALQRKRKYATPNLHQPLRGHAQSLLCPIACYQEARVPSRGHRPFAGSCLALRCPSRLSGSQSLLRGFDLCHPRSYSHARTRAHAVRRTHYIYEHFRQVRSMASS